MRIEQKSAREERTILAAMITDKSVLSRIAARWDSDLFAAAESNRIARWCIEHFKRYGEAPGPDIQQTFAAWAEHKADKPTAELCERLLQAISDEHERNGTLPTSPEFILDMAGAYFTRARVARIASEAQEDLEAGDWERADARMRGYSKVELGATEGIDVLNDWDFSRRIYEEARDQLIVFPGAAGEFFAGQLVRDAFVAIQAPDKRGKSFWLQEFAWQATRQRRRVAYFVIGDMSDVQVGARLHCRAAKIPEKPCTMNWPTGFYYDCVNNRVRPRHKEIPVKKGITANQGYKAFKRIVQSRVKSTVPHLQFFAFPSLLYNVPQIRAMLMGYAAQGWVADVIIIDYADNLGPPISDRESKWDQINTTWAMLRSLSQEMHALVMTATQTDAAAYDTGLIRRGNFSNCKGKLAHVTAMFSLNMSDAEKDDGLVRLNWNLSRASKYNESQVLFAAGCLDVANPMVISTWRAEDGTAEDAEDD